MAGSIRQRRKLVLGILAQADLRRSPHLLLEYNPKQLLNPLFSSLCNTSQTIKWNAVWAFGLITDRIWQLAEEEARVVMRRLLWSLNDESGGIGWGAPEAMAEIMAVNEHLRREYLHMLISYLREDGEEEWMDGNFLELPVLQRGVLWGVARLCRQHRDDIAAFGIKNELLEFVASTDTSVAAHALWCLGFLHPPLAKRLCQKRFPAELSFTTCLRDGPVTISIQQLLKD